jgi:hypothetical protein
MNKVSPGLSGARGLTRRPLAPHPHPRSNRILLTDVNNFRHHSDTSVATLRLYSHRVGTVHSHRRNPQSACSVPLKPLQFDAFALVDFRLPVQRTQWSAYLATNTCANPDVSPRSPQSRWRVADRTAVSEAVVLGVHHDSVYCRFRSSSRKSGGLKAFLSEFC